MNKIYFKLIDWEEIKLKKINKVRDINNIRSQKDNNNPVLINKNTNELIGNFYFEPEEVSEIKRFIKNVEGLVRRSNEYKKYIGYLSNDLKLTSDSFMNNINSDNATLEFHHYPFTLYDIVEIVLNKKIMEDEDFTSISVAEDILELHFNNLIGLVRLSITNHELAHAGEIYIPLNMVFGDVNKFIEIYYDYIYDDHVEKYNKLIDIDNKNSYDNDFKIHRPDKEEE